MIKKIVLLHKGKLLLKNKNSTFRYRVLNTIDPVMFRVFYIITQILVIIDLYNYVYMYTYIYI